jgi:glutathione S-transferase
MSAQIKPIKVWGEGGPNPPKVTIILGELGLPSEIIPVPFSDVKKPEYLAINPNGRLPSIHDPNTGITLWESGAIVEYLIERYDKDHKLSFALGTPEYYHAKQWLFFQVSGQGPYYGQASWFKKFHPEHIPSALDRYVKELHRVTNVLEGWLARQKEEHGSSVGFDGPWLVGNKLSYADIAFILWQKIIAVVLDKDEYNEEDFPHVNEWLGRLTSRETVKSALENSKRVAERAQA